MGGRMMKFARRQILQLGAAAVAAPALPQSAPVLDYPTRPLRWIVGFPPGGGADTVSGLIDFPLVLVVNPSTPARTVAEFIAYARDNPGKISMASFGNRLHFPCRR